MVARITARHREIPATTTRFPARGVLAAGGGVRGGEGSSSTNKDKKRVVYMSKNKMDKKGSKMFTSAVF